jgi:ribosomal protein S18 acetylase RimI-like enzyme
LNNPYKLRDAKTSDYDAIIRLINSPDELFYVYPNGEFPFTLDQLRSLAETRKHLTVVVKDEEVIGFANLYQVEPPASVCIGNIIVARNYRGRGVGRILVYHMMQKAFELHGVAEVRLSVFSDNVPALLLYAGMGFEPYGIEERVHPSGRRLGLIHMRLGREKQQISPAE